MSRSALSSSDEEAISFDDLAYLRELAGWRLHVKPSQLGRAMRLERHGMATITMRDDGSVWITATAKGIEIRNPLSRKVGLGQTIARFFKSKQRGFCETDQATNTEQGESRRPISD